MMNPTSKPFPLPSSGFSTHRLGTLHEDTVPILVHQNVIDGILDYSASDLQQEIGGFLVGGFYQDRQKYVEVEHFFPASETQSSAGSLRFTHETWAHATSKISHVFPDKKIVGWQHTHPDLGVFLSSYDMFIHRNFFSQLWQIAMVVDPVSEEFAFYQWRGSEVVDCGFVCLRACDTA